MIENRLRDSARRHSANADSTAQADTEKERSLDADLLDVDATYDLRDVRFTSQRRLAGRSIVWIKNALGRSLSPVLEKQATYNAANVRIARTLRNDVQALQAQCDDLQQAVTNHQHAIDRLQRESNATHLLGRATLTSASAELVPELVALLASNPPIVDIWCGDGTLVKQLTREFLTAKGVSMDSATVENCRSQGLQVACSDPFAFLDAQLDASLGAVVVSDLPHHLEPYQLAKLLHIAAQKLRPQGVFLCRSAEPSTDTLSPVPGTAIFTVRKYSTEALESILEKYGFGPITIHHHRGAPDEMEPPYDVVVGRLS